MKCLICEKEMELAFEENGYPLCIEDGATLDLGLGFGSKYDALCCFDPITTDHNPFVDENTKWKRAKWATVSTDPMVKLASSNKRRAIICDTCLEKKVHLFVGFWKDDEGKMERIL